MRLTLGNMLKNNQTWGPTCFNLLHQLGTKKIIRSNVTKSARLISKNIYIFLIENTQLSYSTCKKRCRNLSTSLFSQCCYVNDRNSVELYFKIQEILETYPGRVGTFRHFLVPKVARSLSHSSRVHI